MALNLWVRAAVLLMAPALVLVGCQRLTDQTGSSSGSASGTSGNDSEGGGTFLPDTDSSGGQDTTNDMSECNPATQTGCPAGEKCTATKAGGAVVYSCVDDTPSKQPEETCTPDLSSGEDGCPAGYVCLGDVSGSGLCVQLCEVDSNCDQGVCIPDAVESVPYCATECSPFEPSCPAPLQCRRDGQRFACKFVEEGDVGISGDPCTPVEDGGCGSGYVCVPGALVPGCSSDSCCTNLCDRSGPDPCTSPAICNGILSSPAPGFENVGACFVPA
jgi:hypothetical protein